MTVLTTLFSQCEKFGLQPSKDILDRCARATDSCRGATFPVHQYRHLRKCATDGVAVETLAASAVSMKAHLATYTDVPIELLSKVLMTGVQEHILKKSDA